MDNRFGLPYLGFGLGLRFPHYDTVLDTTPQVDWFEIISENFMDAHAGHWEFLAEIRQHYPVVMHGVSLSIGSTDPLNQAYLHKLKKLADFLRVPWLSDHLCWTGIEHKNSHDLLPVPYTEEALTHMARRIRQVQEILERPLILENPSTYLEFSDSTLPEWEFVARLLEDADCGLLLDVNNVYVSAYNHRYDPHTYINALPKDRVVQIHLAGHRNKKTHIVDTHDDHVIDDVWELYAHTLATLGRPVSTMIEWDENIPPFEVLLEELAKARACALPYLPESFRSPSAKVASHAEL